MQQINEGNPVSLNMVNEYTRLYAKDELQLVPQEQPWGFTEQAELINGRVAMAGITAALAVSLDPTLKAFVAVYRASKAIVDDIPDIIEGNMPAVIDDIVSAVSETADSLGM